VCATACGRAAARIEALGIPTVTITRSDFVGVMKNAVSGVGLAPDAAMVTFPINMFLPGADIAALNERRREIYEGLTAWKSQFAQAAGPAKMLEVEGATYEEALTKANNLLLANSWGDGLPLWPANGPSTCPFSSPRWTHASLRTTSTSCRRLPADRSPPSS